MIHVPSFRSTFALVASVALTFVLFQQAAVIPAGLAAAAPHSRTA